MSALDLVEADCPPDVVDRLLWRNAQRILNRHAVRLNGTCHWCDRPAPCEARNVAVRADQVARLPWHEAWRLRNEITGMLPVITAELRGRGAASSPSRPVARTRTRTWVRINVVRASSPSVSHPRPRPPE
jgi:hypothetical protein